MGGKRRKNNFLNLELRSAAEYNVEQTSLLHIFGFFYFSSYFPHLNIYLKWKAIKARWYLSESSQIEVKIFLSIDSYDNKFFEITQKLFTLFNESFSKLNKENVDRKKIIQKTNVSFTDDK